MQITKSKLKKIIKEELASMLQENRPWETEFEKGAHPLQLPPAADVAGVEMIPGVDDDFFRSKGPYALRQGGGTFHEPQVIIDPETGETLGFPGDASIPPWMQEPTLVKGQRVWPTLASDM